MATNFKETITTKRRSRNWIVFISFFYDRQFFSLIYTFTEIKTFKGSQPRSLICSSETMFCSSTSPCLLFPLGSIYLEYSGSPVQAWPLELYWHQSLLFKVLFLSWSLSSCSVFFNTSCILLNSAMSYYVSCCPFPASECFLSVENISEFPNSPHCR